MVELLVVITIIAVLAGFSVPAISGALVRANRAEDLNNAKQLAGVLFMEANENNGLFRRNEDLSATDNAATSTEVFQGLLRDKVLTSPDVISGYATQKFDGDIETDGLEAANVSWSYFAGLTTSDDDRLPLLVSKGNSAVITTEVLTGEAREITLESASTWGQKGIIIAYKGQNVEFEKADKDGNITLGANATPSDDTAALLQP